MNGAERILVFALALGLVPAAAWAGGDANLILGQKVIDDDMLDDAGVDGQTNWGVAVSLDFDWPVMLALDLSRSSEAKTRSLAAAFPIEFHTDVETQEFGVGVRKVWGEKLSPFVGGGLALVRLDARQTESGSFGPGTAFFNTLVDDSDSGIGPWINGGFVYRWPMGFQLGVDVRYSDADADLAATQGPSGVELDSGGIQYGLLAGYHW